ncbi:MAG: DUF3310 domain-containing protein [Paraclostridium sp.]
MAFKIGDKVICDAEHCIDSYLKTYVITKESIGGVVEATRNGIAHSFAIGNLRLIKEEDNMTFKVGDIVRYIGKNLEYGLIGVVSETIGSDRVGFSCDHIKDWVVYIGNIEKVNVGGEIKDMSVGKRGENKFKIGDRVRSCMKYNSDYLVKGAIYTVIDDYPGQSCMHVDLSADCGTELTSVYTGNLELVVPEKKEFHSSHYESDGIECIEFITSNKLDFCRGSIIKYAFRAGDKKGQESLDIKKIIDYAILLAMQEGIDFTYQDAKDIIDYRFEWEGKRK